MQQTLCQMSSSLEVRRVLSLFLKCALAIPALAAVVHCHGVQDDRCKHPKAVGSCTNQAPRSALLRWYYNATIQTCFAFGYAGCDGNTNNFENARECFKTCVWSNNDETTSSCAPSLAGNRGNLVIKPNECPGNTVAKTTWFGPYTCCDKPAEEEFVKASGLCENGTFAQLTSFDEYKATLLGDSCNDLPCADGYHCVQVSRIFAKCCPNA